MDVKKKIKKVNIVTCDLILLTIFSKQKAWSVIHKLLFIYPTSLIKAYLSYDKRCQLYEKINHLIIIWFVPNEKFCIMTPAYWGA